MIHVLGDLNVDLILSGMTVPPAFGKEIIGTERSMAPGGSTANVAIILASTGVPVRFFGCVGNDFYGDFLVSTLQAYGMNTDTVAQTDHDRTCITVSLTYPNDRMFITDLGTLKSNTLADFPAGYQAAGPGPRCVRTAARGRPGQRHDHLTRHGWGSGR